MSDLINALVTVFGVVAVGHLLQRGGWIGEGFWSAAERLTYYLLLPALLVARLAEASLDGLPVGRLTLVLAAGPLLAGGLMLLLRPRRPEAGPAFTSVFQGGIRPNTYVGLAAAGALFGDPGLTLAAVALAVMVPLVNLLSIAVLMRYGGSGDARRPRPLATVLRNPLVLACLAGIALNLAGIGVPQPGYALLDALGGAALPLGLMAVGAGLDWARAWRARSGLLAVSVLKLLLLPAITAAACMVVALDGRPATVAVLFAAVPASASSFILARQLGGDAPLMAGILTLQTALAAFTLPLVLAAQLAL